MLAALLLAAALQDDDEAVEHAKIIRTWNAESLARGKSIYDFSCAPCHGDDGLNPRNANSRRFAADPLKFGAEPLQMFLTLTNGINEMPSQTWLKPEERYDVIHYVRETFFKKQNPTQYFAVDKKYLDDLPKPVKGAVRRELPPMDYGPAMAYELGDLRCALIVRLTEKVNIAYDLLTLSAPAVWQDGFVDLRNTHHTSYKGAERGRIQGSPVRLGPWQWEVGGSFAGKPTNTPRPGVEWRGHFLHGRRVVLDYVVSGRAILETPSLEGGAVVHTLRIGPGEKMRLCAGVSSYAPRLERGVFAGSVAAASSSGTWSTDAGHRLILEVPADKEPRLLKIFRAMPEDDDLDPFVALVAASKPPEDPEPLTRGGGPRWGAALPTRTTRGTEAGAYAFDALGIPFENPWGSWMRLTAFDFLPDGRLAVSTLNGDVWIVSETAWRRFATGLYEPLGLAVVGGKVLVLGRDRITRLHDLDGDGEADRYESFHAVDPVPGGYHAFNFELHADREGRLYYTRSGRKTDFAVNGAVVRVAADGRSSEILATGFRHPNGMTVDAAGRIYAGDNQGEWMPASKVSLVKPGGFYGYEPGPGQRERFEKPILWLPHDMDSSSGGQVRAPAAGWGPLSGRLLHTSYGRARLFAVFEQEVAGRVQAAAVPVGDIFESGLMRGRVGPDGNVWLLGHRGWDTKVKSEGCLLRMRHTGKPARMVVGAAVERGEVRLEFGVPLDPSAAEPARYDARGWNYLYSEKYGSKNWSVKEPGREGVDVLKIAAVKLSEDRRSVRLELPDLAPMDQLKLSVRVPAPGGPDIEQAVYFTIHGVP